MMKDIYIFDSDLQLVGIVDAFKSLIWAKRYKENGDCELYVPATPENLVLCRKGYFILRDDDDMICQIKRVELDTDAENGNYIIATGYDAKRMLDQRIVWSTMTANGNAESFVRSMVDGALGSSAAEDRQMLDSTGRLIFGLGEVSGLTDRLSEQVSYKNVGEKVREYCMKFGWGYRVRLSSGVLHFEVYKGADRTGSVVFSDDYENLSATTYIEDESNMGNVSLIAGEGQGSARFRCIAGDVSGVDRYEVYSDAKDISKTITFGDLKKTYPLSGASIVSSGGGYVYKVTSLDIEILDAGHLEWLEANYPDGEIVTESGVEYYRIADLIIADLPSGSPDDAENVELRDVIYMPYLLERGYENLAEFGYVTSFEGTIEPNTTFAYKVDYDLGDLVTVENEYGISASVRISEVVEVWDDNGYSVEPKFEYITEEG